MARTIKKRVKGGTGGLAATDKVAANGFTRQTTPAIQGLQDLIDAQEDRIAAVKSTYCQQNTQLAKANSTLLMKLTEFEKKISELVRENIILRSKSCVSEQSYKKRLSEHLSILEEGISRRFEEIFHMFSSLRRKENLPLEVTITGTSMKPSELGRKRSSSFRRISSHFQDIETNENKNAVEVQAKKKRKSSRRESIFTPEDFSFAYERSEEQLPVESYAESAYVPETISEPPLTETTSISPPPLPPLLSTGNPLEMHLDLNEDQFQQTHDEGLNFTNAMIDYSIPEETITTGGAEDSIREPDRPGSSKLKIFRDKPEEKINQVNLKSPPTNDIQDKEIAFMPLEASQNKIKHSMRRKNTKTRKKIIDEVMPGTNDSAVHDLIFPRTRRTRGKAIDYTLPSLRAKMRRPSEKLVDATTFTNIQDLQVNRPERRFNKESSRKTSDSPERPDVREGLKEPPEDNESKNSSVDGKAKESPKNSESKNPSVDGKPKESPKDSKSSESSLPKTILDNSLDGRINSSDENKGQDQSSFTSSVSNSSGSSGKALKDITNTPKMKQPPKKKLLKNAIINDLCDRVPSESQNYNTDRTVSFRLQEDDLSIFDLIGGDKVKHPQKTHRTKSKRKA